MKRLTNIRTLSLVCWNILKERVPGQDHQKVIIRFSLPHNVLEFFFFACRLQGTCTYTKHHMHNEALSIFLKGNF